MRAELKIGIKWEGAPSRNTFSPVACVCGHQNINFRVKLCVEFISGIGVVFKLFIIEKKIRSFYLKPTTKILGDEYNK